MESTYQALSALVYNFTNGVNHDIDGDITFYKPHLLPLEEPILELGTGNGRFLIPFLRYGLKMEGLENSPAMLELLKQNLHDYGVQTTIHNLDVLKMDFNQQFKAVLFTNGFLNLLLNETNMQLALRKTYQALTPNGFVMIDLIYPQQFVQGKEIKNIFVIDGQEIIVTNSFQNINLVQKTTTNIIRYQSGDQIETQNFQLTWIEQTNIAAMLKEIGFSQIEFFKQSEHTIIVKAYK
ncbi:class I SAM-dependent methyltransferase [Williamsoniiplasma lucivorax]|uniref:Methyltransferase n=1 Tax=Williamsoniiplasma lucivorax TaxID=209274 RepID=A0A2S5RFR0_9MOLU|nr:class I SAM-dependent methyltransferase [Williamsoniiplasma lucivorax]PPE06140.1 methyltransferase [Williamsoniiplasma lucivorax]